MKAISSLYVKFREKISALFARRLQSIKGTSFLHLPHSKLRVKPLDFGEGGGRGGEGEVLHFVQERQQVCYLAFPRVVNPAPLAQGGFARSGRLTLAHGGNN